MEEPQKDLHTRQAPIVLIVDDNPSIRHVVAWSLKLGGYEPAEAANGLEALQWIEQAVPQGRYPSVILLDLAMPGMDGWSFMEWLQTTWPTNATFPSIIIITAGHADARLLSVYVKQVVTKPFHVRDLMEVVRHWEA